MELISYQDALAGGLRTYFTGKPCKRGHISERYVDGCRCAECARIAARPRAKEWAEKNKQRYHDYQQRYRQLNKEKIAAQQKEWRQKNAPALSQKAKKRRSNNSAAERERRAEKYRRNPEPAKKRSKEWRQKNRARYNETVKDWKRKNPERAKEIWTAGSQNRRARMKDAGKISAADVKVVRFRKTCAHCGALHSKMEIDHIVPLSKRGTNHLSNLQLLCRPCNRSKHSKDYAAWAAGQ